MDDLISRQAVIDALYNWSNHTMTDAEAWHLRQVIGDIKSMPSLQPEPKWIPVSERLPDVAVAGEIEVMGYDGQTECIDATYLISKPVVAKGKDGKPIIAIYEVDDDERKYWVNDADGTITDGITKWMPIPESYQEENAE